MGIVLIGIQFTFCLIYFTELFVISLQMTVEDEMKEMGDYSIYYSYNKTKEVLMKYYNKNEQIKLLIDEYDYRCSNNRRTFQKNHPFVTVEGAYRRTRNNVAQKLAKKINGRMVGNPPQFMVMSTYFFNDTSELRRAFYSLGVYAAACRAREFLTTNPVIIAGYWVDQTSFGISKMFRNLPPRDSVLYEWPDDLLKPDSVYLINPTANYPPIPIHPYKPMRPYTFRDKLIDAMLRFRNPSITEISTSSNYKDVITVIVNFMNNYLNTTYIT